MGRTISFTLKCIEVGKHFIWYHILPPYSPLPVCQQTILPVYAGPYSTHYMKKVACWHKKENAILQPQTSGLKPVKMFFLLLKGLVTEMKFSNTNRLKYYEVCGAFCIKYIIVLSSFNIFMGFFI